MSTYSEEKKHPDRKRGGEGGSTLIVSLTVKILFFFVDNFPLRNQGTLWSFPSTSKMPWFPFL